MQQLMEYPVLISALIILILSVAYKIWSPKRSPQKLPPSPPSLPILGHLHLLKEPLHRCLHALAQKHGPIISLRLASRLVVVVSSPSAVEECFTTNDVVLANRPKLISNRYVSYNCSTMGTSPYGDHWRNLRRISALDVFSSHRLNAFLASRREEVRTLVGDLHKASRQNGFGFAKVALRPMFEELTLNVAMRMVAGKRYSKEAQSEEAREFREIITELFACAGASYAGDYFPILEWVDFQGYVKKVRRLGARADELFQGLIDEQRRSGSLEKGDSMIGHLLSLQESQPDYYTDEIIKGLILDIIFAGTDTTAGTLEWAMAELLNQPEVLEKAKNELDEEIGNDRFVEEADVSRLIYLQNIISETLRLHPAGPLLVPHCTSKPCTLEGYTIPSNTMLLVNAWAIHRDPRWWDDALRFVPERFENVQLESASKYKYIPFGLGRRACPGAGLANRLLGLTLGCLIQCFDWKRVRDAEIDLSEGTGLTMPKAQALEALCSVRGHMNNMLALSFGLHQ